MVEKIQNCGNCKFWGREVAAIYEVKNKHAAFSECRRNPPFVDFESSIPFAGVFPMVFENEWCGEWQLLGYESDVNIQDLPIRARRVISRYIKENAMAEIRKRFLDANGEKVSVQDLFRIGCRRLMRMNEFGVTTAKAVNSHLEKRGFTGWLDT